MSTTANLPVRLSAAEALTFEEVSELMGMLHKSMTPGPADGLIETIFKGRPEIMAQVEAAQARMRLFYTKLSVLRAELQDARGEAHTVRFSFATRQQADEFLELWSASFETDYLATAMASDLKHLYAERFTTDAGALLVMANMEK